MRTIPEWKAKHDDEAIPPRVQLRIFEKHNKRCAKCGRLLIPGKWQCDHITALVNDGKHEESNLQPLCVSPCHSDKTRADVAEKSRTYRRKLTAAGVKKPSRFQTARSGPFKQKLSGAIERR